MLILIRIQCHKTKERKEGKIIHSSQYSSAREHKGKKVVVIGACTSGHDIAQDHYLHGVGMYRPSALFYSEELDSLDFRCHDVPTKFDLRYVYQRRNQTDDGWWVPENTLH